ncbi:MAG TPA: GGDEF domain-containing protein [Acidobacteriaceae bacterium]|nr:GGDEF domain-containing protein [Acidobacteriaceae bacterium]
MPRVPSRTANSLLKDRRILWLLAVFAVTTLCLGSVVAMVIYSDARNAIASEGRVGHTQDVLLNLSAISQQLDRVDLYGQLYRATEEEDNLRSAQGAAVTLNTLVDRLSGLVADSPPEEGRARELAAATATLTKDLARLTPYGRSLRGDVVNCRLVLNLMQDDERVMLARHDTEADRAVLFDMARRASVIVIGAVLNLVLFGFLIRDAVRRGRFEERITEANSRLRSTVERMGEQAFESRLLIDARDEVALCLGVNDAQEATVRYFAQLLPGTAGSLCVINNSRKVLETAGVWGALRGSAAFEGFAPECCCALRTGRARWRKPEQSEVHCSHFVGTPPERYLCLPVTAHGETLGVVTIECRTVEAAVTAEARQNAIASLGEMAAMAIAGLNLREKLERQSIRDGLTGMFNRSFMEVALERELHRAARQRRELAVMMVDIDHFKQFNDSFGHEAGDVVLREVAENLRLGVRSEDIACRFGGEEFVVILPEITSNAAMDRAELLRQRVAELAVRYHGQPLRQVTISIGVAIYPLNAETPEDLLRWADRAMYTAKHRGRDRVVQADSSILV